MGDDNTIVRLNVGVPRNLKKRIKIYCAKEEIDMKELVIMAIENMLDELESNLQT
ncbi:hypothetical protein [Peribacillus asahii]|uniref:hypothetical protein n=1 Tax=Peribacillus asahii TaxID=228899 RepID=UPI00207A47A6|nr:hypothetical protein [Peribacillus asahii]USK72636.1 hypothetical protein LIS76_23615 [Peribacillus asahii]USK72752.1 hypothetical protein LIS76_23795 [Peribacillus asahii]